MKIGIVGKSRYIDADKIEYRETKKIYDGYDSEGSEYYRHEPIAYKSDIDEIPTADVVEVVRCKDCKHFTEGMIGDDLEYFCKLTSGMVNPAPDFYCSYGERREE